MAADTLVPQSQGRVAQDSREEDEEEMAWLRAQHGGATLVGPGAKALRGPPWDHSASGDHSAGPPSHTEPSPAFPRISCRRLRGSSTWSLCRGHHWTRSCGGSWMRRPCRRERWALDTTPYPLTRVPPL